MNWSQYIRVTCPSSSAGTQVSAQQSDWNTGLLDGGWLLEAQSSDGLQVLSSVSKHDHATYVEG